MHLFGILIGGLSLVLSINLLVKHNLGLLLLLSELFQHDLGVVPLSLQLVLQLHCHLALSLLELILLIGISLTAALDFVLKLQILLVDTALLSEDVKDVGVAHLLLVLEVLDARLSDRDVDLDEVRLLSGLHGLGLSPLGEVAVVALASLHILLPSVRQDRVVQDLNVLVETLTLLLELLLLGFLL